jgi:solute:Na+ symporter, SSS family
VASLAGKANSIATIFTLDVYKKVLATDASEKRLVNIGKATVIVSMILAVIIAPHLGIDKKGGFQFIQEYTGFVSPGIFAMFLLGFFWKKTTSSAAIFATVGGFLMSLFFKFLPNWADLSFLQPYGFAAPNPANGGVIEIPFLDRMGFVFVFCIVSMYIISMIENGKGEKSHGLEVDTKMFRTTPAFAAGSLIIVGILAAIYGIYW